MPGIDKVTNDPLGVFGAIAMGAHQERESSVRGQRWMK